VIKVLGAQLVDHSQYSALMFPKITIRDQVIAVLHVKAGPVAAGGHRHELSHGMGGLEGDTMLPTTSDLRAESKEFPFFVVSIFCGFFVCFWPE